MWASTITISQLSEDNLRIILKQANLDNSGSRDMLIKRLQNYEDSKLGNF